MSSAPTNQKAYKIAAEWSGLTAGGCLNHVNWRFNPQVFIKVKEKRSVRIKLVQASDTKFFHIGFYVAKIDPAYANRRQLQLSKDQLIIKAGFDAKKEIIADVMLEADQEYFVVPCTFRPREESKFTCVFSAESELVLRLPSPDAEWKFVEVSGEWSGSNAGGCRNNPTCPRNPQYLIKTSAKPTETTVIIHQDAKEQFDSIGFYLLKTNDKDYKLEKLPSADMLAKTPFSSNREASARATLQPNAMYALVASTFDPGKESIFNIVVFSDEPIKLKELADRSTLTLQGEWRDVTAGGSVSTHTWRNNPQYFILAHQKVTVTITLTQSTADRQLHPIGFYVAKSSANQELGHRLLIWKQDEVLFKPNFEMKRSVSTRLTLERSSTPYVVIPCTIKGGLQKEFTMGVSLVEPADVPNPKELINVLPCNYTWQLKSLRGRWRGEQAAGARNNTQLAHNPQFSLKVESPCTVVVILVVRQKDLTSSIYLLKAKENELLKDIKDDMILDKSTTAGDETYVSRELQKGFYNLIPALSEAGRESFFEILVYASVEDIELSHAGTTQARSGAAAMPLAAAAKGSPVVTRNLGPPPSNPPPPTPPEKEREKPSSPVNPSPVAAAASASPQSNPVLTGGDDSMGRWIVEMSDVELFEKIGQGGYGAVFRGALKPKGGAGDKREVAIKKLIFRDEDEAKEFRKEVVLMSKLIHPKIVAFIGVCTDGNEMCILTEFCSRGNVTQILKSTPDLSWTIKLRMATDSAKGMMYLHSCRPPIVHRDLKSLNLLVDKDWNTKVADFGLSKATSGQSMNSRMGSLNWVAPEILLQSSSYSPEADSYSFGLVLWELVTHTVPYVGMSPLQIVKIKDTATMPALPPGVHKDYQKLVKDCCEPKPKHRPNFQAILERLEGFVRDGIVPYTKQA